MQTSDRLMVIGIFAERDRAERALADLRGLGLRDDQVGLVGPEAGVGDLIPTDSQPGGWLSADLSEEPSQAYLRELRAGRAVAAVQPDGPAATGASRYHEAAAILRRNGAYLIDNALE